MTGIGLDRLRGERACFNSPEWSGSTSPVKTEPHQIVLLLFCCGCFGRGRSTRCLCQHPRRLIVQREPSMTNNCWPSRSRKSALGATLVRDVKEKLCYIALDYDTELKSTSKCSTKCDSDIRKNLYVNVVLSSGTTMFQEIVECMMKELTALAPFRVCVYFFHFSRERSCRQRDCCSAFASRH